MYGMTCFLALAAMVYVSGAALPDPPFPQETSHKLMISPQLVGAQFLKLVVSRDHVPYVLTSKGVARVLDDQLVLDPSFRPLAGRIATDLTLSPDGKLYYLFPNEWLSNDDAGLAQGQLPEGVYSRIGVTTDGSVLVGGAGGFAVATMNSVQPLSVQTAGSERWIAASKQGAWLSDGETLWKWTGHSAEIVGTVPGLTALEASGPAVSVGTSNGLYHVPPLQGLVAGKLPHRTITALSGVSGGWWSGTPHGAFFVSDGSPSLWAGPVGGPSAPAPSVRYYAGKRWMADDDVRGVAPDSDGTVWILTATGLQAIHYPEWTLLDKARWFERKVRSRHMRYGLTSERRLRNPGDRTTSELIDTDNDGGWSSYWLASQAFRYHVTRDPEAKVWAWETFAALERLQTIHTNTGFPARTFERTGFKVSDPDRWHRAPDPRWEWKAHTSSDEIASHLFGYAILWECASDTEPEKQRIRDVVDRIANHIVDHDLYLVDVDGKPTLWGRWNPTYVNGFAPSVFDRRLNSSEIIALLQFAYRITGTERFREIAMDLLEKKGYRANIVRSMKELQATPGVVHQGVELGDTWNHSDDELAFITYWVLCRFALNPELKAEFQGAVADHWQFEKAERYPFWNFVAAGCGLTDHDPEGALWTLRGFAVDTISWTVENSHREDITKLPPNFRVQELAELLPPGERPAVRCNTQPFILDGGDGGHTELAGDEYLLGYWMGRFVGDIAAPHPQ